MAKAKKKVRSISFRIWRIMVQFMCVLLVVFASISIYLYKESELEYNYMELESYARNPKIQEFMLERDKVYGDELSEEIQERREDHFSIYKFPVEKIDGVYKVDISNIFDYENKDDDVLRYKSIIDEIENNIRENGSNFNKGYKRFGIETYYYYVDWNDESTIASVYINSSLRFAKILINIVEVFMALMVATFIISKLVANYIVRPIKEIELFAEEISNKRWNAVAPESDSKEINQVISAIENMKNSLEEVEIREKEFLHARSHDLKTPVMVIKGYAQAIMDGVVINGEKSGAETILEESERLEHKITQLLRLNSLSNNVSEEVNEYIRVDRLLKSLSNKFKNLNAEIEWETTYEEVEILGNSEMLLIAFENIIENQLRYVKSSIKIKMTKDKTLKIVISNDGDHFSIDPPSSLFELYRKDKSGNYGLGLAITKQIMDTHGAKVSARNEEVGVSFELEFKKFSDVTN